MLVEPISVRNITQAIPGLNFKGMEGQCQRQFTTLAGPVVTSLQCLTAMLARTVLSLVQCVPFPYSALLYMNDDFEGGEFIFTEMDAKTVTVRKAAPKRDWGFLLQCYRLPRIVLVVECLLFLSTKCKRYKWIA